MISTTPRTCLLAALAILLTEPLFAALKPSAIPPAPIPIQVLTAKKVFLSKYVLWTLRAPLAPGKNFDDNVNASVTALIDALKSMTAKRGETELMPN
jgi:hypothetical protein